MSVPEFRVRADAAAIAACVGVSAAVFLGFVRPGVASRVEARTAAASISAEAAALDALARERAALRENVARISARLDASPVRLRPAAELNTVLNEVTELAGRFGLTVEKLSSGQSSRGRLLTMTPVAVSTVGAFHDIAAFMDALAAAHPEMAAASFTLQSAEPENDDTHGTDSDAAERSRTRLVMDLEWYSDPDAMPAMPTTRSAGKVGG